MKRFELHYTRIDKEHGPLTESSRHKTRALAEKYARRLVNISKPGTWTFKLTDHGATTRAKNPRIPRKELAGVSKLYKGFREKAPSRARRVSVSIPRALMVMGKAEFIGYRTTHGDEAKLYKHDFKPGSRPLLCVDQHGKIFFVGGRYRVTSRGIVDLDSKRRELD